MSSYAESASTSPPPSSLKRVVIAAVIGNVLEWFDFVVYGFLAVTISRSSSPPAIPPYRCS